MGMPSSVLNTNIASIIAQRNLAGAQQSLATSVERLSSGLRINRAKDDAAGMAVASVIGSQIRTSATAHRNVNDAISMMQTAEGALAEATEMLQRIKELATQGANDSMSKEQYYFLIQEMKQLMDEIGNVAGRTTYNGNNLLGNFKTTGTGGAIAIDHTSPSGNNGPWEFLTGAGNNDKMQIDLIPIWESAESAKSKGNLGTGHGDGAIKVGALHALYVRIAWLADPSSSGGAPVTGEGYDTFGQKDGTGDRSDVSVPTTSTYGESASQVISAAEKSLVDLVDDSILQINAHRSYFGAFYGRLEHNIANLAAQTENLTAALSRVQDTDYGAETANLTRVQILQQAATAMLAQANAMPNVVLGLLRQQ